MSKPTNKTPVDNKGKEITITPGPRWVMDQSIPFWPKMIIQRLTKNQQMRGGYHMGRRGEKTVVALGGRTFPQRNKFTGTRKTA